MGRNALKVEAYIDTDVLLYKFGFSCEQSIEWEDGVWTHTGNTDRAKYEFDNLVDTIIDDLSKWYDDDVFVEINMCFSSKSGSFRKLIWDGYKKSRKGKRKPVIMDDLRQWVEDCYNCISEPWLEGDDILGIWGAMYDVPLKPTGTVKVMCSIDKDLMTVPGYHYNWDKRELGVVSVDRATASKNFYLQTLSGDSVDEYPGCPTIGPKRGLKIIEDALKDGVPLWEAVVKTFESHNKDKLFALQMARCAYILQPDDFDNECGSIELWSPRKAKGDR